MISYVPFILFNVITPFYFHSPLLSLTCTPQSPSIHSVQRVHYNIFYAFCSVMFSLQFVLVMSPSIKLFLLLYSHSAVWANNFLPLIILFKCVNNIISPFILSSVDTMLSHPYKTFFLQCSSV